MSFIVLAKSSTEFAEADIDFFILNSGKGEADPENRTNG